jgi:hypothetical protein
MPNDQPLRTIEGYEVSSNYVAGFARSLRALNLFEQVRGRLSPQLMEVLETTSSNRWWPPTAPEAAAKVVHERHGEERVEQLGYGIMMPSVAAAFKAAITALKSDPAAFMHKFNEFSAASVRGVKVVFDQTDSVSGDLVVTYPRPPPKSNGPLWKGALVRTFESTGIPKLRVESMRFVPFASFRFDVRWD